MIVDFFKGFTVGLLASIPLGPIGVLCIQRTLSKGKNSGFITGLGATTTDTFFAAISLFSLSFVHKLLSEYRNWVMVIGGVIVALFGLKLFFTNPVKQIKRVKTSGKRYWEDYFSTILMTVTNPGAFFLILGMFAFVGINTDGSNPLNLIAITLLGVATGAVLWWYVLSSGVNHFRNRMRLKQLVMINRVAGIIVMVLGMISVFEGLYRVLFPIQ